MKTFILLVVLIVGFLYASAIAKGFKDCINQSVTQSTVKVSKHINKKMTDKVKTSITNQSFSKVGN